MSKLLLVLNQPASYAGNTLLLDALTQAGISSHDYDIVQASDSSRASYHIQRYGCIVALGDAAARACVVDWAGSVADRRGYLWEGAAGCKVLSTLDPEHCVLRMDASGINGMLLVADLERAKKEAKVAGLHRTKRNVQIISQPDRYCEEACLAIRKAGYAACDIECSDPQTLLCIGFATSPLQAYVFVGAALESALSIAGDASVQKVFQNGQFDAYFLKTRCGVEVAGWTDDCMIAWHALWPEIAGKGARGSKRTRKSLAFLASIYTESPEWWKDYETDEAGMYELNGRDCCITFEIMQNLQREIQEQDVEAIYRHEMSMMPVLVAIQERGLAVDEQARNRAIETLARRASAVEQRIRELAEPLLRERQVSITKPHLMFGTKRCACCNGGKSKAKACWSCAGLASAPGKRQQAELKPCKVCNGAGRFETFDFNPASGAQQQDLFFHVLNLPRRYNDGALTTDERALKSILAEIAA